MLPPKIAFVDIETTGARASYDRIIEIGILRVEDNKLVQSFHSLINPEAHLPPEIIQLTGITPNELLSAPLFRHIKNDILDILRDCVFVAHNVRFDYSFLKHEFLRENHSFTSKHFCTVRLSRLLYPLEKRHNLDSIINRFAFTCEKRHRALDDAKILFSFYQKIQEIFPEEIYTKAISTALKRPSIPLQLASSDIENLPELPGVYTFYGENRTPLYIGKSINLKDRILSHFTGDITSPVDMKISQQIHSIETTVTAGELGALFLESQQIKKALPLFNKKLRIKRELIGLSATTGEDGYMRLSFFPLTSVSPESLYGFGQTAQNGIIGFFRSKKQAKVYLSFLAKEHELCEKLLGLENTAGECFAHRLERCHGACIQKELAIKYNMRLVKAIADIKIKPWPFDGPITITEENEFTGKQEQFLIDKWCVLGQYTSQDQAMDTVQSNQTLLFDVDTYKILRQFIMNPKNKQKIRMLKQFTSPVNTLRYDSSPNEQIEREHAHY